MSNFPQQDQCAVIFLKEREGGSIIQQQCPCSPPCLRPSPAPEAVPVPGVTVPVAWGHTEEAGNWSGAELRVQAAHGHNGFKAKCNTLPTLFRPWLFRASQKRAAFEVTTKKKMRRDEEEGELPSSRSGNDLHPLLCPPKGAHKTAVLLQAPGQLSAGFGCLFHSPSLSPR